MKLILQIPFYVFCFSSLLILSIISKSPLYLEGTELIVSESSALKPGFGGNPFDYAVHIFMDIHNRPCIRHALLGVSGIYCWFNTLNGQYYIGQGKDVYKRISCYYGQYYLNHNKMTSVICRAILKNSIDVFVLIILEVDCVSLNLAEQK